ncbi:GNAT family N-acetyltransferase [Demequina gelatinilytica]|uniref:GNAT family N-acetyltransferase n=1 Tax=Demequina gelatinilytica TaxID=1638980 RepID=UPI000783B203|nr:GNAT family N-acetyltransferase [Demequina gelatinilytica]
MLIRDLDGDPGLELLPFVVDAFDWRGNQGWTLESVLAHPHVSAYAAEWGSRAGDLALVAVDDAGSPVGAGWWRFAEPGRPGYGYVAADIPELGLGVSRSHRGRGIGSALLDALVARARETGLRGLSLSVEDGNDGARRLYVRSGFVTVGRSGEADTMVLDLAP